LTQHHEPQAYRARKYIERYTQLNIYQENRCKIMSLDLYLRTKARRTVEEIESVIIPLGWKKSDEEKSYYWYQTENLESTRGCWLFYSFDVEGEPEGTQLVFHSYSNAGRSYEDLEAQNNVIKLLRKNYGGSLYNPQEGNSSYLTNDIPKLSKAEKACGLVFTHFQENLSRARLVANDNPKGKTNLGGFDSYFLTLDTHILRNNMTIPFLVATLESFLKNFFIKYIESHSEIQERLFEKKSKIDYIQLKELLSGNKSIVEVEAEEYTFQNLFSANNAYKKYLEVDIFEILNKKKKYKNSYSIVRTVISELIELRHKIAHTAFIDVGLDKSRVEKYIFYLGLAGDLFAEKFLIEKNFRIDLDEYV